MTRPDQEAFRKVLQELKDSIEAELAGGKDDRDRIRPDNAIGRLTRMEAIQAQQISAAGAARLRKRLQQIERAFKAIDDGLYGSCVQCGDDIPVGRLEIRPESRLCVTCAVR